MKKRKARLRGTKTAGKFEQKKLLERMEQILENPRLVLPKTNKNDIAAKIYDKVYAEMQVAKEQYKNPPSFISSIFGKKPKDPLAKAYASSLTILDSIGNSPPPNTLLCEVIICSTREVPDLGIPKMKIIGHSLFSFSKLTFLNEV